MVNYPKDWEEKKLGNIIDLYDNLRVPVSKDKRTHGRTPYYGANGIQDHVLGYTHYGEFVLLAEDGANSLAEYPIKYITGKAWINNHVHVVSGKSNIADTTFLSYALKKVNYENILVGGTRAKLNGKTLKNIEIVIPPFPEQQAIADALTAFDTHINNLAKLIEKKKMIRDGAVEDLVSGKRRLAGFSGKWEEVNLRDICFENGLVRGPFGGSLKKECFVSKGYKVYEQKNAIYGDVNIGNYYIGDQKFEELKRFELKKDDFIVSCSGTIGKIHRMPCNFEKGIINQALLKITLDSAKCNLDFFNIYFKWQKFQMKIIDDTQGGAIKNLVGMDKFKRTMLYIPTSLSEQKAIADILTSMDKEISGLEEEKEKYIALKAGAMDDLLTGKIRLV